MRNVKWVKGIKGGLTSIAIAPIAFAISCNSDDILSKAKIVNHEQFLSIENININLGKNDDDKIELRETLPEYLNLKINFIDKNGIVHAIDKDKINTPNTKAYNAGKLAGKLLNGEFKFILSIKEANRKNYKFASNNSNPFEKEWAISSKNYFKNYANKDTRRTDPSNQQSGNWWIENNILKFSDDVKYILLPKKFSGMDTINDVKLPKSLEIIGDNGLFALKNIKSLVIPSSLKEIGDYAFANASLLTDFYLTDDSKLKTIGDYAFQSAKFEYLKIPVGVKSIGNKSFMNSPLQVVSFDKNSQLETIGDYAFQMYNPLSRNLYLPKGLTNIGDYAFANAELNSLNIPEGVTNIGDYAFSKSRLSSGLNFDGDSKLKTIGNRAFLSAGLTDLSVPKGVTDIGERAFALAFFQTLKFAPDAQLKTIGEGAFQFAKIKSLSIPKGVTHIGNQAFKNTPLTSLSIPASVKTIGRSAFLKSKLDAGGLAFEGDSQLETIGSSAFSSAKLKSLIIPKGVTHIGDYAFWQSRLIGGLTFASGSQLKIIGSNAFLHAQLKTLSIPSYVTEIGVGAFGLSQLEPDKLIFASDSRLKIIGAGAFSQSRLRALILPSSVKEIHARAFLNSQLDYLHIPAGMTHIGDKAFNATTWDHNKSMFNFINKSLIKLTKNMFSDIIELNPL